MSTKRRNAALATLALTCLSAIGMVRGLINPLRNETCPQFELLTDPERLQLNTAQVQINGTPRQRSLDGVLLTPPPLSNLAFTIRRTLALPAWLFRPTLAIPGPKEPDKSEVRTIWVDGEAVPTLFTYAMHRTSQRFAAYTFAYRGKPELSPFWIRVLEAPVAAVIGPRPITYIGVAGDEDSMHMPELEKEATQFIKAAWRLYQETCNP